MPTLPWTATHRADNVTNVVVMASTLRLKSFRKVPGFLLAAMKVRRQVLAAPGAVGVSLKTRLPRKTFYTLSSWQSQSALDDFVRGEPHRSTMSRYHPEMAESKFEFWTQPAGDPPTWRQALDVLGA